MSTEQKEPLSEENILFLYRLVDEIVMRLDENHLYEYSDIIDIIRLSLFEIAYEGKTDGQ